MFFGLVKSVNIKHTFKKPIFNYLIFSKLMEYFLSPPFSRFLLLIPSVSPSGFFVLGYLTQQLLTNSGYVGLIGIGLAMPLLRIIKFANNFILTWIYGWNY